MFDWIKEVSQLDEDVTVESLTRQRDELNQRIAKLQTEESQAKNLPDDTADGSE